MSFIFRFQNVTKDISRCSRVRGNDTISLTILQGVLRVGDHVDEMYCGRGTNVQRGTYIRRTLICVHRPYWYVLSQNRLTSTFKTGTPPFGGTLDGYTSRNTVLTGTLTHNRTIGCSFTLGVRISVFFYSRWLFDLINIAPKKILT